MATAKPPRTLQEAIIFFSDYENCRKAVEAIRWPDGTVACPTCGSEHVTYLASQKRYKCYEKHPRAQFSLKVGTIFEDSALPLQKWLPALWLLVNCKNGISSYELARALGITQKSAWFMLARLRMALHLEHDGQFNGHVEADETFIGGKARNMHKSKIRRLGISQKRSMIGKVAVAGLLQRTTGDQPSQVRVIAAPNTRRKVLQPNIEKNVADGATIHTDSLPSYQYLSFSPFAERYVHNVIDHAQTYVDGQIHTNGMENFWSLLKRAIKGTYVSVEPFHLFRYLDEQMYRFNNRKMTDAARFFSSLAGIMGKRLTYSALTGEALPEPA